MTNAPGWRGHGAECGCGNLALGCDLAEDAASAGAAVLRRAAERAAFGGELGRRRVVQALGAATFAAAFDRVCPVFDVQDAFAEATPTPERGRT